MLCFVVLLLLFFIYIFFLILIFFFWLVNLKAEPDYMMPDRGRMGLVLPGWGGRM